MMNTGRHVSMVMIVALVGVFGPIGRAASAPASPDRAAALRAASGGEVRLSYHNGTGLLRFMGAEASRPIAVRGGAALAALPPEESAVAGARAFLAEYGALFGVANPADDLAVMRVRAADQGRAFVRFQQRYQGLPVLGGELIVQLDADRNVLSAGGEMLPGIAVSPAPALDASAAERAAVQAASRWYGLEASALRAAPAALWIYDPVLITPFDGPTRLVWRTEVTARDLLPIRELVLIDAQRGSVALHFNQVDTLKNRVIYDNNNNRAFGLPGNGPVRTEGQPASGIADVDAAYDYAGHTYDFFFNVHGRDSLDGAGMTLTSTTRYCPASLSQPCPYPNAFWNGVQMAYGQGFAAADDVVGHELAHGVTQFESNLFYYYQSGAINESFSDLWGEFVDLVNGAGSDTPGVRWQMGEDIPGGAIRNMQNPQLFGDPDRMTSPNYKLAVAETDPTFDNGGVHTNSGVNNKAVYLMTDGDTFNGITVSALGITKTATIYYEVQTNLLTSGADYADLYDQLYQACLNKVGTVGISAGDCQEVRDATNAVEMNLQPTANFNTDAPLCPASQTLASTLFFDDLESGGANWGTGALVGSNRWGLNADFAHSGSVALLGNDFPAVTSDSFVAMTTSVTLPAESYLHFAHAYGFEDPNWDGGVVEYSTNGGGSWNDAGTLFQVNGYNGTISTDDTNPLGGRTGFIADSHGYISSRLLLSSLAGQSVRFRWRMGIDSTGFDQGWWVDDVRIYTCSGSAVPTSIVYLPLIQKILAPDPGFWESTTGDEFYVTPDRAFVDEFAIYITVNGPGCGSYKITHTTPEPITNNQFSFTGPFYASGTFASTTSASGTDGLNNFFIGGCGTVSGGPWSWTATWQNASQPTFQSAWLVQPVTVEAASADPPAHAATLAE